MDGQSQALQYKEQILTESSGNRSLNIHQELYNLHEISHTETADTDFFEYCKEVQNFIVICISNRNGEVLFTRDLNKNTGWGLPGGQIYQDEGIVDAANRIVENEVGTPIDEVTPVAYMKNKFIHDKSSTYDSITHTGIALAAITKAQSKNSRDHRRIATNDP